MSAGTLHNCFQGGRQRQAICILILSDRVVNPKEACDSRVLWCAHCEAAVQFAIRTIVHQRNLLGLGKQLHLFLLDGLCEAENHFPDFLAAGKTIVWIDFPGLHVSEELMKIIRWTW